MVHTDNIIRAIHSISLMWQVFGPNPQSCRGQQQYGCDVSPASIALFLFCFFCGVIGYGTQFVSSCFMLRGFLQTCLICLPVIVPSRSIFDRLPHPGRIPFLFLPAFISLSASPSSFSICCFPCRSTPAIQVQIWVYIGLQTREQLSQLI